MGSGGNIFYVWKKVFGNWRYFLLVIIIAFLFYEFNVLISSWKTIVSFYSSLGFFGVIKLIFILSWGFGGTILYHSYISLIIISLMFGVLFSLIGFKIFAKTGQSSKGVGFFGGLGVFLGALVPGCAACGIGLAGVLGLSTAFVTFLPYEGLELSILAIGILGFAIIKVSKDLTTCNSCKIKLNTKKMRVNRKVPIHSRSLKFTRMKGGNK